MEGMKLSPPSASQGGPFGAQTLSSLSLSPGHPTHPLCLLLLQRPPSPSLLYYRSGNRGPECGTAGPRSLSQLGTELALDLGH